MSEDQAISVAVNNGNGSNIGGGNGTGGIFTSRSGLLTTEIKPLTGQNYLPWKRQITILSKLNGLESALTSDKPGSHNDMAATLLLIEAMDDAHQEQVEAEPSAKAIMASLERQYANRSVATKHRLLSDFLKSTKESTDTLNKHIGKLREKRNALHNLGEEFTEDFFQVVLINSLPQEFGNFLELWELMHPSMKNTEFLIEVLTQKERNQTAKLELPTALVVDTKKNKKNEGMIPKEQCLAMSVEEKKKVTKCGICQQKGHWARECPSKNEQGEPSASFMVPSGEHKEETGQSANVILNLGNLYPELKTMWVLDSGATEHMCNNSSWFKKIEYYETPRKASVGDGSPIEVLRIGKIEGKTGAKKANR